MCNVSWRVKLEAKMGIEMKILWSLLLEKYILFYDERIRWWILSLLEFYSTWSRVKLKFNDQRVQLPAWINNSIATKLSFLLDYSLIAFWPSLIRSLPIAFSKRFFFFLVARRLLYRNRISVHRHRNELENVWNIPIDCAVTIYGELHSISAIEAREPRHKKELPPPDWLTTELISTPWTFFLALSGVTQHWVTMNM